MMANVSTILRNQSGPQMERQDVAVSRGAEVSDGRVQEAEAEGIGWSGDDFDF